MPESQNKIVNSVAGNSIFSVDTGSAITEQPDLESMTIVGADGESAHNVREINPATQSEVGVPLGRDTFVFQTTEIGDFTESVSTVLGYTVVEYSGIPAELVDVMSGDWILTNKGMMVRAVTIFEDIIITVDTPDAVEDSSPQFYKFDQPTQEDLQGTDVRGERSDFRPPGRPGL